MLSLKRQAKFEADDILIFFSTFHIRNLILTFHVNRLQTILMTCQDLFFMKKRKKKL